MSENKYAKVIKATGFVVLFGGILLSFILGDVLKTQVGSYYVREEYNWFLTSIGSISSFISGILFIGFGEIINLLHLNYNEQVQIRTKLNNSGKTNNITQIMKDDQYIHQWRCSKCNKMISSSPCPYCDYEY